MQIIHNGECTKDCNLLTDIRIAKETGYDGIEIIGRKLDRYLAQGLAIENLRIYLDELPAASIGYVADIERDAPDEKKTLLAEVDRLCDLAKKLGIPLVQLTSGPINIGLGLEPPASYADILKMPWPELRELTVRNLREIADIGSGYGIVFYLEPLAWTPFHTLDQALEILDVVERENITLIMDFWHLFTTGTRPEDIARKVKKEMIGGVHLCDSVSGDGSNHADRDVFTGGGIIPLQEWVDAIKATGYDGWWAGEMFSHKHRELDQWEVAKSIRDLMHMLLI